MTAVLIIMLCLSVISLVLNVLFCAVFGEGHVKKQGYSAEDLMRMGQGVGVISVFSSFIAILLTCVMLFLV